MIVLNTEPTDYSKRAVEVWRSAGYEYQASDWASVDQSEYFPYVDILIVRLARMIDKTVLSKFPNLDLVVTATTGLDHIDIDELDRQGVKLVSLRGQNKFLNSIPSTAEHTWALLLSLLRHIPEAQQHVKQGLWERDRFKGNQLKGKSIGIIGMGRTGSKIAEVARVFDMAVAYYDPYKTIPALGLKCDSLQDLLRTSDIITIHIHLSESTRQLINKSNIKDLKHGVFLVNTSRGGVWDEHAIAEALSNKKIAGVATDVLSTELHDVSKSPLWEMLQQKQRVIITPHIGGATYEAMHACEEYIAQLVTNSS